MSGFSRYVKKTLAGCDKILLLLCIAASACGLVLVYSATASFGSQSAFQTQCICAALGVIAFAAATFVDMERLRRFWPLIALVNVVLQILPLFFGSSEGSNRGWIRFWGMGLQPAEIGKLLFILSFSAHLYSLGEDNSSCLSVLGLVAHWGITAGLVIVCSRDDGMALAYVFIGLFLCFMAGVKYRWFLLAGASLAVAAPYAWRYLLDTYQKLRILVIFDPSLDPDKAYQANQTRKAIGSGLLSGSGFMEGRLTQNSLIPTKHTDAIFAVAGEEFGFIGTFAVMAVLTLLILRCGITAARTQGHVSSLVCAGLAGMLIFQTVLNIGMNIGVLPVIGLTLPFISYGGSSLVTMFAAVGIAAGARLHCTKRDPLGGYYER